MTVARVQRGGSLTNIGYLDVKVSVEEIEAIKKVASDANNPNRRLAKMQLEFVRELDGMQRAGLHTSYMEDDEQLICTCGLILFGQKNSIELVMDSTYADPLDLDLLERHQQIAAGPIHTVRGHQRLPRCKDMAVALIYELTWDETRRTFMYDAFCQECMEQVSRVVGMEARAFVRFHNKECRRLRPRKEHA